MRNGRCTYCFKTITHTRCGRKKNSKKLQDRLFSPRELLLALYIDKEGSAEEKLGIYFDMYDVDKNNALDMKEIKKMITAIKSQVMCQTVAHDFIK